MLIAVWMMMIAAQGQVPAAPAAQPVAPPPLVRIMAPPNPPAPPPGWAEANPHQPAQMINLAEVFTEPNYPFFAKAQADEGQVRFRVKVDERGVASDCVVTQPAAAVTLNRPTCDLVLAKGRFVPARDRKGRAVASSFSRLVAWVLINRDLAVLESTFERVVLTFDGAGKVTCRTEASDTVEVDPRTCDTILATPMVRAQAMPPSAEVKAMMARFDLVSENSSFTGADATALAAQVGKKAGEQLNLRTITRVTVDAKGKVSGCAIVERLESPVGGTIAGGGSDATCEKMALMTFAPDKGVGERTLVTVNAAYFRPR